MSELVQKLVDLASECGMTISPKKAWVVINSHMGLFTEAQLMSKAPELLAEASMPIANVPFFTIQDKSVLDVLLRGEAWHADPSKARESGTIYLRDADRKACGGKEPIYIFQPHFWNTRREHTYSVNADLNELRSEMSTDLEDLYGKYLYVFSLPEDLPVATGHNSCWWVRVVPELTKDSLLAAYEICPLFDWWLSSYCTQYISPDFRQHELHHLLTCPNPILVQNLVRNRDVQPVETGGA